MNLLHSLQTKLTASFIILILTVTALTFLITHQEAEDALMEATQTELLAVTAIAASQFEGEDAAALAALRVGDEATPAFLHLEARMQHIRDAHEDIVIVYTMRHTDDAVQILVDADYGKKDVQGTGIGAPYEAVTPTLLRGFTEPTVDDDFYTDQWGTFLSAYAPIKDSSGTVVALLGVDMKRDKVVARLEHIGNTIYFVMGAGILLAGLFILLFSKTIIRDIRHLNDVANRISTGDMDVDVDVNRKDEIGELADSFGRMVASLKIMMTVGRDD
jgi:HAMP domain-containing protein